MKKILKYNIRELSITDDRLYDPVISFAAFIIATLVVIIQILLKDKFFALKVIMISEIVRFIWYYIYEVNDGIK